MLLVLESKIMIEFSFVIEISVICNCMSVKVVKIEEMWKICKQNTRMSIYKETLRLNMGKTLWQYWSLISRAINLVVSWAM